MKEISVHKMGHVVGSYVAKKVSKLEQSEYLEYGAEILLGSIIKLSAIFIISTMVGVVLEVSVLLIVIGLIRTLSGGAHCSTYYKCLVISVLILNLLGYTIKTVYPFISLLPRSVLLGIIVLSWLLYWYYAPQAPVNKPFENRARELSFRWYTLIVVGMLSATSVIIGRGNLISWTIAFALLWQAFTLTPVGYWFIGLLDILLTLRRKGGDVLCLK